MDTAMKPRYTDQHRKTYQIPKLGTKSEFIGFFRNTQCNSKVVVNWENETIPNVHFVGYYKFPSLVIFNFPIAGNLKSQLWLFLIFPLLVILDSQTRLFLT